MNRKFLRAAILALGLVGCTNLPPSPYALLGPINGTPIRLGVIEATTTKNNHDTATPFSDTGDALEGKVLLMQCSAAANVNFAGTTNAVTASATATNAAYGVKLAADERVIVTMAPGYKWIAVVGSANCTIWELV
jgi:hypothetical protein